MRAIYSMHHRVSDVHQFQNHAMQLSKTSKVIEDVAKGKYYAGLSYEQDARTWKNKGYPVSIVYPIEGTMLNVDGIVLHKIHSSCNIKVSAIFNKHTRVQQQSSFS